ncbi:hypothetical protein BMS3Abin09_00596 [bacterium BMS3Abin09]|nr:hypothetical protein BMS3Abin09_00596 [bacterium BMS3Abin09]
MAQSESMPAKKAETARLTLNFLKSLKTANPVKAPITPMEKISAPHVLSPPCARKSA